jgi:hypothetical protein
MFVECTKKIESARLALNKRADLPNVSYFSDRHLPARTANPKSFEGATRPAEPHTQFC